METRNRLIKKKITSDEVNSITYRQASLADKKKDPKLLEYAHRVWSNMSDFRDGFYRSYRMVYGDQWSDSITIWKNGKEQTMSMREYMAREGHIPLQANMIKPMVNTILGVLVKEQNSPVCNAIDRKEQQYGEVMTATLRANCNKNELDTLTFSCVRDYLLCGAGCCKERYGVRSGDVEDSWTEYVAPQYLILDTGMKDPRMWDVKSVGTWYEMSRDELIKAFVRSNADMQLLNEAYGERFNPYREYHGTQLTDMHEEGTVEFMKPIDPSKFCVLEMWTEEIKQRVRLHDTNEGTIEIVDADDIQSLREIDNINAERTTAATMAGWSPEEIPLIEKEYFIDSFWYCRILAPDGTILSEFESPYAGKEHPYTFLVTPLADGRLTGYIVDAIDLQMVLNRALCLYEWGIRNEVKGMTFIPQDAIPDTVSNEEFFEHMRIDNYCVYDSNKSKQVKPEIFHAKSSTMDITSIMNTVKNMLESSLSITGAIQGKTPYSGTSAAMYAQMTANSSTPIASVMKVVRTFMEKMAVKKLKSIAKFYGEERYAKIVGSIDGVFNNDNLNLHDVGDIEYDLVLKEGVESPVYRQTANDYLMAFMQAGAVSPDEVLKHGYFPFADKIIQEREARQAEMEAAQQMQQNQTPEPVAQPPQQGGVNMGVRMAENVMAQYGSQENGNTIHSTRPIVQ